MLSVFPTALSALPSALPGVVTSAFPLLHIFVIITAGVLGTLLCAKIKNTHRDIFENALGAFVLMLGILQGWNLLFTPDREVLEPTGSMLIIASLLLGALLGEAIQVEWIFSKLGGLMHGLFWKEKPQRKRATKTEDFETPLSDAFRYNSDGFIAATLICAFSATTIQAILVAQPAGDAAFLSVKLAVDALAVFALAALYGSSVPFAAVPTLIMEGIFLLSVAGVTEDSPPIPTEQLSLIGAVIIIALGLKLAFGKKLRASHLTPALIIPPLFRLIMTLSETES